VDVINRKQKGEIMLEQKIDELNKNIKELAGIMLFFSEQLRDRWGQINDTAPVPTTTEVSTPDPEELKKLCLAIVRADREKANQIKDIIAGFGGAKQIKDVPVENLPDLKTQLEALAA
jgi:hypothetical protein